MVVPPQMTIVYVKDPSWVSKMSNYQLDTTGLKFVGLPTDVESRDLSRRKNCLTGPLYSWRVSKPGKNYINADRCTVKPAHAGEQKTVPSSYDLKKIKCILAFSTLIKLLMVTKCEYKLLGISQSIVAKWLPSYSYSLDSYFVQRSVKTFFYKYIWRMWDYFRLVKCLIIIICFSI